MAEKNKGRTSFLQLPRNLYFRIFSYFGHIEMCRCSRTCKKFRDICSDDFLWKNLYHAYWGENNNVEDGQWKIAYKKELKLGKKYKPFYGPVRHAWHSIEETMDKLDPQINLTLNDGLSMKEMAKMEKIFGIEIPKAIKCIYSFHDGQVMKKKNGIFGNVEVYQYTRTEYFFPLTVEKLDIGVKSLVVGGYDYTRFHCLLQDALPFKAGNVIAKSGPSKLTYLVIAHSFLDYFLEYAQKLREGYFPVVKNRIFRFYKNPSWFSISHWMKVEVSVAFVHELEKYVYVHAYHVRFSMDKNAPPEMACQLESRELDVSGEATRWGGSFTNNSSVKGVGVMGECPTFTPGKVFSYVSCVRTFYAAAHMAGHFKFRNLISGKRYELAFPDLTLKCAPLSTLHVDDADDVLKYQYRISSRCISLDYVNYHGMQQFGTVFYRDF